jgi:hypothetical protein
LALGGWSDSSQKESIRVWLGEEVVENLINDTILPSGRILILKQIGVSIAYLSFSCLVLTVRVYLGQEWLNYDIFPIR